MTKVDEAQAALDRLRREARTSLWFWTLLTVLWVGLVVLWFVRRAVAGGESASVVDVVVALAVASPVLLAWVRRVGGVRREARLLSRVQPATVVEQSGCDLVLDVVGARISVRVEGVRGASLAARQPVWLALGVNRRPVAVVMQDPARFGRHTLWGCRVL